VRTPPDLPSREEIRARGATGMGEPSLRRRNRRKRELGGIVPRSEQREGRRARRNSAEE